jgi:hypothetical protein
MIDLDELEKILKEVWKELIKEIVQQEKSSR